MYSKFALSALAAAAVLGLAMSTASAGPPLAVKGTVKGVYKPVPLSKLGAMAKPLAVKGTIKGVYKPVPLSKLGAMAKPFPKPFPKPGGWHHGHHHHHHVFWPKPYPRPIIRPYPVVTPVVSGPIVAAAAAPAPTCLTKEYTPQGAVLFKDNCTNEWAMNPSLTTAQ